MGLVWIDMKERQPKDGQTCLTKMKHGIIQGVYHADEMMFSGYYWHDLEWNAYAWVPIEEG